MIGFELAAMIALAGELDMSTVQAVAGKLSRGEDPYSVQGVAAREERFTEPLPDLTDCEVGLDPSSTRTYIQLNFTCSDDGGKFVHEVFFNENDDGLVRVYVNTLPKALGPTQTALVADSLPSPRVQFSRLAKAVQKGEDATLGGIVPLTQGQVEKLRTLSDCDWRSGRASMQDKNEWYSFVKCESDEKNTSSMVLATFDGDRRIVAVDIGRGGIVSQSRTVSR